MKLTTKTVAIEGLANQLQGWLAVDDRRFGLLTSIDGSQLIVLLLDPLSGGAQLFEATLKNNIYRSLTLTFPQLHWFERLVWNLFGIVPDQHPRLKPVVIHEQYPTEFYPLRQAALADTAERVPHDPQHFLEVQGDGVWELPVGPIHAGVIEPGHFRFSCLGELIVNLELKFGYVHRGVEKQMTQVPWRRGRFIVEAAASDTAAANALAHAIAIESLFEEIEIPQQAQVLRSIALESERLAMHIIDVGGMMTDIGLISMAANMGRLRGIALGVAQILSGSRFLRGYILPGGVRSLPSKAQLEQMKTSLVSLRKQLTPVLSMLRDNQAAASRMVGIGKIKQSLAFDFGFVGVAGRACGLDYDTRRHFAQGVFPQQAPPIALEQGGDIQARTNVRIKEIWASLDAIENLLAQVTDGPIYVELPDQLPANQAGTGIVEAFRGELIHLCITGEGGKIRRYAIKDPSCNNWTAISIAVRDNLIADFPLCNKSLALSYSGVDL